MSDSPPPKPPQPESPKEPSGKSPRRTDRTPSTNVLIWVAIGAVVLVGLYFVADTRGGQRKSLSEFERDVRNNKLTPENVYKLTIHPGYVRYQDQPEKTSADDKRQAQTYTIPTHNMGA